MIPIYNLYYMLSYAFDALHENEFRRIAREHFEQADELFAEILILGITHQIRQGLLCEYQPVCEAMTTLRGKIELGKSLCMQTLRRQELICRYDEFTEDAWLNRILKCAGEYLLKFGKINVNQRKKLKRFRVYFQNVCLVKPSDIPWNSLRFTRNTRTYRMLIGISRLVLETFIQSPNARERGVRTPHFEDSQRLSRLYEKFLLQYYRRHFPEFRARSQVIQWDIPPEEAGDFLPKMKTDVTLSTKNNVLIIDAKFYSYVFQKSPFVEVRKMFQSHNLYQIFAYVKNFSAQHPEKNVSGLLLYAKTEEEDLPTLDWYNMSGHRIGIGTLNLNTTWDEICDALNHIATAVNRHPIPPMSAVHNHF